MFNTPTEAYNYIMENHLEVDFFSSMMMHKCDFTIAEIADGKFVVDNSYVFFRSKGYNINIQIEDEEIAAAAKNGLYISSFISKKSSNRNVHFLVSMYPASMKGQFEEEIVQDVVKYMIISTVVACNLNEETKIGDFCGK